MGLAPTLSLPAMPHVKAFDLLGAASYSMYINLLGLPSGAIATTRVATGEEAPRKSSRDTVLRRAQNTDLGSAGLPIGVQVSALPWREDIVLAVMGTLEKWASVKSDYPSACVVPA